MTFPSPAFTLGTSGGAYVPMIDFVSFTPARFACAELVTSSRYAVEMTPSTFAPFCAAIRRKIGLAETFPRNVVGDQPTFVAVTSAVIACDGRAKITNV